MKSPKKPWRLWVELLLVVLYPIAMYWATSGEWKLATFITLVYVGAVVGRRLRYRRFVANGGEEAAKKVRAMETAKIRRPIWVDVLVVVLLLAWFYWARNNKWLMVTPVVLIGVAGLVEQYIRDKRFFANCKAATAEQD